MCFKFTAVLGEGILFTRSLLGVRGPQRTSVAAKKIATTKKAVVAVSFMNLDLSANHFVAIRLTPFASFLLSRAFGKTFILVRLVCGPLTAAACMFRVVRLTPWLGALRRASSDLPGLLPFSIPSISNISIMGASVNTNPFSGFFDRRIVLFGQPTVSPRW